MFLLSENMLYLFFLLAEKTAHEGQVQIQRGRFFQRVTRITDSILYFDLNILNDDFNS